jgi:hypothetical protein
MLLVLFLDEAHGRRLYLKDPGVPQKHDRLLEEAFRTDDLDL